MIINGDIWRMEKNNTEGLEFYHIYKNDKLFASHFTSTNETRLFQEGMPNEDWGCQGDVLTDEHPDSDRVALLLMDAQVL